MVKNNMFIEFFKLMRIKHYIKNLLLFLPLIFSGNFFDKKNLFICFVGFLAFSFLASIVYVINDIKDIEKDKKHQLKKSRPLASGTVSIFGAKILIVILFVCLFICNFYLLKITNFKFLYLELLYLILNLGYSFGLKDVPILDVVILVSGFVIRVFFGGLITNIQISTWLYLTVMSASFYMGLGKRRNELIKNKSNSRKVLDKYNEEFLDKFMYVFLVLAVVFYSLWCIDAKNIGAFGNNMLLTIPLILVILMKYSLNVEKDSFGDPVDVFIHDKFLIFLSLLFLLMIIGVLYLK